MVPLSSQQRHKVSLVGSRMCFLFRAASGRSVVVLRCFAGFFLPFSPIFESSAGLENALKDCSRTCFSILALRQGNVYGKTLGKDSPGSRSSMGAADSSQSRSPARQRWEQLSCRDGKTHGSAKLEHGGQNIIPQCFPCPAVCCSFLCISVSSHSWQHGESVGGIHVLQLSL